MTRRTNGIIAHICGHFQLENLVYFKGFAFPGNSREFPGNRCSREVIPGNLGFGNMLNPSHTFRVKEGEEKITHKSLGI